MLYKTLNNGLKMPMLGLGVFQITDQSKCEEIVYQALKNGYRLIDTAAVYLNESAVGKAIARSGIPRHEIFLTTKLWVQDMSYEKAKQAAQRSMQRLGVDYLDLYLIHQPFGDYHGAWRALEEMYREGKIKAIGVSNFSEVRLLDIMQSHQIKPAINQIEIHPFTQQVSNCQFMKKHNIQIEAWGPFAQAKNDIFTNPVLLQIAKKYNKKISQIILRWLLQQDIIAIPKTEKEERLLENFDVFNFELLEEDMLQIATLDTKKTIIRDHQDPEFVEMLLNWKVDI